MTSHLVFCTIYFLYRTGPLLSIRIKGWIFSCFLHQKHKQQTYAKQSLFSHGQRPRGLVLSDFDCYLCKCRWWEERHYLVPVGSSYFHNHHLQCTTLSTKGSSCQLLLLIYKPVKDTFLYIFALQGHLDQSQMQGRCPSSFQKTLLHQEEMGQIILLQS